MSYVERLEDGVPRRHPLLALEEADLEFVTRLVLASGSLKEVAKSYGVSYPTIRARLDRLIVRLAEQLGARPPDAMSELLAQFVERGELHVDTARAIQKLHRSEITKGE